MIYYTDASSVSEQTTTLKTTHRLCNWQAFSLCYVPMYMGVALLSPALVAPEANAATACAVTVFYLVVGVVAHAIALVWAKRRENAR